MTEDKKKKEFLPELLSLFLDDLRIQLANFKEFIQSLDKPDFPQSSSSLLIGICHSLIASAKIVHLEEIEKLAKNLEDYFYRLLAEKKIISEDQKNLFLEIYQLLEKISSQDSKELLNYISSHHEDFQKTEKSLHEEPTSQKAPLQVSSIVAAAAEVSWPAPEKKMIELFKIEIETQVKTLSQGLLNYQSAKSDLKLLEPLMRSAHSIKGAARVFSFEPIVQLAHSIEDCFALAQQSKIVIDDNLSDLIFKALDALGNIVNVAPLEINTKLQANSSQLYRLIEDFKTYNYQTKIIQESPTTKEIKSEGTKKEKIESSEPDRVLRLAAHHLDRLMGLAAESMVESRWLSPFCDSLLRLKNSQRNVLNQLEFLRNHLDDSSRNKNNILHFQSLRHAMLEIQSDLSDRVSDLEMFITRHSNLTDRLYEEVIESRMRPFADGVEAFPRMVWESARRWKKKARLEIAGKSTLIDRDILEKLHAPLSHLLRNAVDHGIEEPEERIAKGKLPEGVIRLEAFHRGGMLSITVSDDGQGVNLAKLRKKIVDDNMISSERAEMLSERELLDFLFLPGYSTSEKVTDIAGRGIGLNIVQNMLQDVLGSIHIENTSGKGIAFTLQLPVTLSVLRALIVKIDGGTFAFPLARLEQTLLLPKSKIQLAENREYFIYQGNNVGLVLASQVLGLSTGKSSFDYFSVIVLRNRTDYYGLVVDDFLGEKELVLQDLHTNLGKIPCVLAGSVMENGDPILIIDIEDAVESMNKLFSSQQTYKMPLENKQILEVESKKRVLVVDDSISVREVECRLLQNKGYVVDSAVNGADAWNAVRVESYDLVVTDVDMPRMNGIDLVRHIKNDARLKDLPVMIVSYKESDSDRLLGLEAGASYYLSKSTFGDETLINAVVDLIGEP